MNNLIRFIALLFISTCWGVTDADRHCIGEIQKLHAPRKNKGTKSIEVECSRWSKRILTNHYIVPPKLMYVMLAAEDSNDMDKVRVRYLVDNQEVTITQSPCIFHVTLENAEALSSDASSDDHKKKVLEVATRIFNGGANLEHTAVSQFEGYLVGLLKRKNHSNKEYPWMDDVYWWNDGELIGFAFIKHRGQQTSAMISWDCMFNQSWFQQSRSDRYLEKDRTM